jgi:hypothetical protein
MYGDGVQVGVYARFLLARDSQRQGDANKAAALNAEIMSKFAGAVDHTGKLLIDSIQKESK